MIAEQRSVTDRIIAWNWLNVVMFAVEKSTMMSGSVLTFATAAAETTDDRFVLTFTSRLTALETPVDCSVPWLRAEDAPVLMTVIWLSAVEAAVLSTVAWLVSLEIPVEIDVTADFTDDMPTVAVDSEAEKISQVLFSVDTCADVEPAVAFDCAVLRTVPMLVTDDSSVESEVVCERAVDICVESEEI